MGLFQNLFGAKQKAIGIQELARIFSGGAWTNESLMNQYGKSLYVFAAVNKIAQKVSAVDLKLFEIANSKGELKEHPSHEILDLLYRPNPFQTRSEFFKITTINKKMTGEAFWWKVRGNRSKPLELWNLRPDLMTIVADKEKFIKRYELTKLDGTKEHFEPQDIIHFKDPNPTDIYRGMSPLRPAQSRIETEEYSTNFQRDFFLNNARPDALLLSEDMLAPEQRTDMLAAWNAKHKGRGRNSKVGILEGGVTYQQVAVTQKEMDYIESLKFTRDDILVAFGVPKSVITTDDVNLANAQAGLTTFLSETIKPEVAQLVEVINEMLVIPDFGDRFYVDFQDPTPEDRDMKLKEYVAGYGKWLTANEIREALNLEPAPNGDTLAEAGQNAFARPPAAADEAQKIFRGRHQLKARMEMIESIADDVVKSLKKPNAKKSKKEKAKESLLKSAEIREQYKALVNKKIDKRSEKFQKQVEAESEKQMNRVLKSVDAKDFSPNEYGIELKPVVKDFNFDKKKENQIFTELALPFMQEAALESGQEAMDLIGTGETFEYKPSLEKELKERAKFFAKSVNDTTLEKLSKTLSEGLEAGEGIAELRDRIKAVYKEFPEHRAELIARTEATVINNKGFLEAYSQSKVVNSHEWISTNDLRTRPEHVKLDGEIVEVGKNFSNGLPYPQEPNCRCVISPVV